MTESAAAEMQALVDLVLPTAQGLVDEGGEFAPFAAVVTASGERQVVVPVSETEVEVETARNGVYDRLEKWSEGVIRAAAVCLDVRLHEPVETDAICVHVEHAQAAAIRVLAPFAKEAREPTAFGEPFVDPAESEIFNFANPPR